jgi:hypothetical protein
MAENTPSTSSESYLSREQLPYLESEAHIDFQKGNAEHKSYETVQAEAAAIKVEQTTATPEIPSTPEEYMLAVGERLEHFRNLTQGEFDLAA